MWRWEDVKMWGVKMWGCEEEKVWRWDDVKMRRCEDEQMWGGEGVKMRRCEDEKMWRWEDVKMWRCEDVRRRRCEDEQMWRWADVKMRRCEDVRMWRCEDVRRRRCEDEKMWRWEDVLQTPTIGRTLRSDALGKEIKTSIPLDYSDCFDLFCFTSGFSFQIDLGHPMHSMPSQPTLWAVAPCALRRCSFFGLHRWAPWLSWTHIENRASIISHISIPSLGCFNSTSHMFLFYHEFQDISSFLGYDMVWHGMTSRWFFAFLLGMALPKLQVLRTSGLRRRHWHGRGEEEPSLGKEASRWAALGRIFRDVFFMGKWWF